MLSIPSLYTFYESACVPYCDEDLLAKTTLTVHYSRIYHAVSAGPSSPANGSLSKSFLHRLSRQRQCSSCFQRRSSPHFAHRHRRAASNRQLFFKPETLSFPRCQVRHIDMELPQRFRRRSAHRRLIRTDRRRPRLLGRSERSRPDHR